MIVILVASILYPAQSFFSGRFPRFDLRPLETVQEITLDGRQIDRLDISFPAGSLEILPTQDETVRIIERNTIGEKLLNCSSAGGKLTLSMNRAPKNLEIFLFPVGFSDSQEQLTVYLPAKQYREAALKVSSGSAQVDSLKAQTLDLRLSSGSVKLTGVEAGTAAVGVSSGSLKGALSAEKIGCEISSGVLELSGAFRSVNASVSSGNMRLESSAAPEALDLLTRSGSLAFFMPESSGFRLKYRLSSGSIQGDEFGINVSRGAGTLLYKNGGPEYSAECSSGQIRIQKAG
jgi:hypothetical protein